MYRSIEAKFWTDPKIRELSPAHKLLFLYLITNHHSHVSGIYYLPKVLIQHETGLSASEVEKGIDTLSKGYLCLYDPSAEVVWVRKMLRYQHGGEKIRQAVATQLESLHKCPIIQAFLDEYDDLDIPYRYPIDTHAPVYKDQDQEQDKDQEQIETLSSENPDEVPVSISPMAMIDGWNNICAGHGSLPRKTQVSDALKHKITLRLKEQPEHDFWERVFNKCVDTPFLSGVNGGWHATFNWLMENQENAVKVYEGNYDDVRAAYRQRA